MGGTPAYMAPEMIFTRPEQIGFAADIYLLGAILYEIVTGSPPHEGATVSACLNAASKNQIRPTDKSDELVTISLKAMATLPADRYASVGDFQEAIRQYWSHSQSVLLSNRAAEDLQAAAEREDYDRYARALLGFQEAYELWEGNTRAKEGIAETSLAYARRALSKGNFDLAASLLDEANAEHAPLLREIRAAQKEQDARQQRLKTAKRIGAALVATILVVVTRRLLLDQSEYNRAEAAKTAAQESEKVAVAAEGGSGAAKTSPPRRPSKRPVREKNAAEAARRDEEPPRTKPRDRQECRRSPEELRQTMPPRKETAAKEEAEAAKEKEEYGAYVARIGLASAKIDENAFGMARALLDECPRAASQLGMGPADAPLPPERPQYRRARTHRSPRPLARRQAPRHRRAGRHGPALGSGYRQGDRPFQPAGNMFSPPPSRPTASTWPWARTIVPPT